MSRVVTVLFFAAIKEISGAAEARYELPEGVRTVGDLSAHLERTVPALRGRLGAVRFAVNETFAAPDTPLAGNDVVAVIPPVSGG